MQAPTKERVLVVDDEPQVLVALEDLLSDRFQVLKTSSGDEALQIVEREREIAVVITDQRMPKMNGDELLARIGSATNTQHILITGFADLSAVIHAVNEGKLFAYVTKPWNAEDLLLKVLSAAEHFRLCKELAYERQLLHDLMDNIPDWIYFKDEELGLRRANRSFTSMTDAGDGGLVGKRTADVFPALALAQTEAEERNILSEGKPVLDVVREYGWDGARHWFSETKAPIRANDGTVVGLVGISRDVTERVTTQEALRESEQRLQRQTRLLNSILDSMGEGVIAVGQSGEILLFNRRARQILGTQLRGRLPANWMKVCGVFQADAKSQVPRDRDPLLCAMKGEAIPETELFVRSANGSGARIAVTASALVDDAGKLAGGIALLRDVTQQRSLEQHLTQAQKMEAIGRLAGGVAHDFNNLLAVILSYAELARADMDAESTSRADLAELIAAAQRAAGLTRQLLAFGRRQVVQPRAVQLNEVVANLQNMLRRVIGEDIDLVTKLSPSLGTIMADPGQLEQIVVNLTVNARDAMPNGGTLTVETANVSLDAEYTAAHAGMAPGEFVQLTVSDPGLGMDAETKRHIFEPFFTTKEVGSGTGLGLSTVYGIVQQGGGHIAVDSELGRGTAFKIYFPRIDGPASQPQDRSVPAPASKGSATVLLVEDEEAVRRVAVRILRGAGYTVLEASSASDARLICGERGASIDVLLTDVVMPEIRGPELAKQLAAFNPKMRIIYMSGYPGAAVMQQGVIDAGAAYIEKPFSPDSLTDKVREVLAATD